MDQEKPVTAAYGDDSLAPETLLTELEEYERKLSGVLSRFRGRDIRSMGMAEIDKDSYTRLIIEISDLLEDALGPNRYSKSVRSIFGGFGSSYQGVQNTLGIIQAAHTRLTRNPDLLTKKRAEGFTRQREHIFIIHGRDEAKWRELKDMIMNTFHLRPIILSEQPDTGKTVIEKFEHYAATCSYAIALFTPDDEIIVGDEKYLQARPNVVYELGWFCGRLGRSSTMLLLKEGTSIFSDFGGILQKRFKTNISELEGSIRIDLTAAGILE